MTFLFTDDIIIIMNIPTIPDLKIGEYCGSGAFGDVWIAEDLSGVQRAVKVLNKARLSSMKVLQKEQKALSLFRQYAPKHRNLIEIYHVGETDDEIYYIMELGDNANIKGQYEPDTLEHRLQNEYVFSAEECISLTVSILDAVKMLHDAELVHRDIKPSNIIYCNGVAKLADIGLVASNSSNLSFGGTRYFIPPDQSMGREADLYAVGKMLYCIFTGLPPQDFPTLPDFLVENMTPERKLINKVISKACAKKNDARFATSAEFINALNGDDTSLNKKWWNKLFLWFSSSATVLAAVFGGFFMHAGNGKHNTQNKPASADPSENGDKNKKALEREKESILKTSDERRAFAKLLLKYQLYYSRNEFDRALKQLDEIAERWPEYPKEKLDIFRAIIEKKRKKVEVK
jgi:serine/threonine protein kinase